VAQTLAALGKGDAPFQVAVRQKLTKANNQNGLSSRPRAARTDHYFEIKNSRRISIPRQLELPTRTSKRAYRAALSVNNCNVFSWGNMNDLKEEISRISCSAPTITFSLRQLRYFPLLRKTGTSGREQLLSAITPYLRF